MEAAADIQNFENLIQPLTDEIALLRQKAKKLEQEANQKRFLVTVLKKLSKGWRQTDPGKYGAAYFFLTKRGERAVVKEFLPPDTKIFTNQKEWLEHARGEHHLFDAVAPAYEVISVEEIYKMVCSRCATAQPLIEEYEQTYDSAEGDEWRKRRLLVCLNCKGVYIIGKADIRPHRF